MKKRLGRELRQIAVLVIAVIALLILVWLLSHMGGILIWFQTNWLPFLIGFAVALIGKALMNSLFGDKEEQE